MSSICSGRCLLIYIQVMIYIQTILLLHKFSEFYYFPTPWMNAILCGISYTKERKRTHRLIFLWNLPTKFPSTVEKR